MTKKQEFYAFWSYDLYPYVIGARILETCDDGRVIIEGYGGSRVSPAMIVPGPTGLKLKNQLQVLKSEYDLAKSSLAHKYRNLERQTFEDLSLDWRVFHYIKK